jgi:hypothetical protein
MSIVAGSLALNPEILQYCHMRSGEMADLKRWRTLAGSVALASQRVVSGECAALISAQSMGRLHGGRLWEVSELTLFYLPARELQSPLRELELEAPGTAAELETQRCESLCFLRRHHTLW